MIARTGGTMSLRSLRVQEGQGPGLEAKRGAVIVIAGLNLATGGDLVQGKGEDTTVTIAAEVRIDIVEREGTAGRGDTVTTETTLALEDIDKILSLHEEQQRLMSLRWGDKPLKRGGL